MNILFLTQVVPYPPDAGPKVKTLNVIRYLAGKDYRVTLVTFVRPDEQEYLEVMKQYCDQVYSVPISRSRTKDLMFFSRSLVSGRPFLIERDDIQEMRLLVRELFSYYDVVHADQLSMAQFGLHPVGEKDNRDSRIAGPEGKPSPCLVFDAHNAVYKILERMVQRVPWYMKPLISREASQVQLFEAQVVRNFDHTFTVTEIDRLALLQADKDNNSQGKSISVVPIGIDIEKIQPLPIEPDSFSILAMGTLHYPPNADGIRWFLEEVFPIVRSAVPETHLTIIGKNPPKDFIKIAQRKANSISVAGYVPDVKPFVQEAGVILVPLLAGGGMRVRILEALAYARPVVTTTTGLEGIEALPGKDILVADTPEDFAQETIRLLRDPALRKEIGGNGRQFVERRYDWRVVFKGYDTFYQKIDTERRPGTGLNGRS